MLEYYASLEDNLTLLVANWKWAMYAKDHETADGNDDFFHMMVVHEKAMMMVMMVMVVMMMMVMMVRIIMLLRWECEGSAKME